MASRNTLHLFPCLVTQSWLKIICFLKPVVWIVTEFSETWVL